MFALLLVAFLLSGVFEVIGNLSGDRVDNIDSSAPIYVKVGKELVLLLIVTVLLLPRWRRLRFDSLGIASTAIALGLMVPAIFFLRPTSSATIGFIYLSISLGMLLMFSIAAPYVRADQFHRWFLVPVVVMILVTQFIEIRYAPASFYNETGLFGLDRRAGIAVIPTTAGCLAALCLARARGLLLLCCLMVLGIANSTMAWCAAALILTARLKNLRVLLAVAPLILLALAVLILMRQGLSTSAGTRYGLLMDSLNVLNLWIPSDIGAGATAKAVALSRADSFIADSTPLEFFHVFGVLPGTLLYIWLVALAGKTGGWRTAAFFAGISIGFLLTESWILTASLLFVGAHLQLASSAASPSERDAAKTLPVGAHAALPAQAKSGSPAGPPGSPPPKVAVLMATYNGGAWLREQVESILDQRGVKAVIYVSDDSSTDETPHLLERWRAEGKMSLLPAAAERFGNANRNFLRLMMESPLADEEYVAFADQDDIWLEDKLLRAVQLLSGTAYQAYSSNVIAFWPDGREAVTRKAQPQRRFDHLFESSGPGCTFVIPRKQFEALREWVIAHRDDATSLRVHDWLIYAFARISGWKWFIDPVPSLRYRQHGGNERGVNVGRKAAWVRWQEARSGQYLGEVLAYRRVLGGSTPYDASLHRLNLFDRLRLALASTHFRRRLRDRLVLALIFLTSRRP